MLSKTYIRRIIRSYLKHLPIKVKYAILFGSTAKNTRLKDSDIDLIVVSDDFKSIKFVDRIILLSRYWKHNVVDLNVFGYTSKEIKSLRGKNIVVSEALDYGEIIKVKK
jgi:hypothetical protein